MIMKVTRDGVTIPRRLLGEATVVDVRQEDDRVVLVPVVETAHEESAPPPEHDPIWDLGKNPIDLSVTDAAANLDHYLNEEVMKDHAS